MIVAWRSTRSVVCAASCEARHFGVRSAIPAVRAERLCSDGIFAPPDFARYRAVSHSVREIFARHTDLIEPLSLDAAYLDVTENKTGLPLNLTASAGIIQRYNSFPSRRDSNVTHPPSLSRRAAGRPALSTEYRQSRLGLMTTAELRPL